MKRKLFALLLAMLLTAPLASCGKDESSAPSETTPPSTSEQASAATSEFVLSAAVNGNGSIAYAEKGGELSFDDQYPTTGVQINVVGSATYLFGAKPDPGAKFVKWTKDGKDFSKEAQITVSVSAETELVAVFTNA